MPKRHGRVPRRHGRGYPQGQLGTKQAWGFDHRNYIFSKHLGPIHGSSARVLQEVLLGYCRLDSHRN